MIQAFSKITKLIKLNKREKILLSVTLFIALFFILDKFIFGNLIDKVTSINMDIKSLEGAIKDQDRLFSRRSSVLKEKEMFRFYLKPGPAKEEEMGKLIKEIEDIAKQNEIIIKSIDPLPVEESKYFNKYKIEIRCFCSLEQWIKFIYFIDSSISLYEIDRVRISKVESETNQVDCSLLINKIASR